MCTSKWQQKCNAWATVTHKGRHFYPILQSGIHFLSSYVDKRKMDFDNMTHCRVVYCKKKMMRTNNDNLISFAILYYLLGMRL